MKRSTTSKTSRGTSDDGLIRNIEFPSVNSGLVPEESVVIQFWLDEKLQSPIDRSFSVVKLFQFFFFLLCLWCVADLSIQFRDPTVVPLVRGKFHDFPPNGNHAWSRTPGFPKIYFLYSIPFISNTSTHPSKFFHSWKSNILAKSSQLINISPHGKIRHPYLLVSFSPNFKRANLEERVCYEILFALTHTSDSEDISVGNSFEERNFGLDSGGEKRGTLATGRIYFRLLPALRLCC